MTGCATPPLTKNELAAVEAAAAAQTFQIDCPAGCRISYRDPNTPLGLDRGTNGWDAALGITQAVTGVIGAAVVPAAMGYVAIEGFRRLQNSGQVDNSIVNNGRMDSPDDYTSTPTVVEQPQPVIVTQPPVQVVDQPPPIVVPPPDPIIVDQPTLVPGGF